VPDGVASIVTGVLEKNIIEGTGVEARLADDRPEAGKTGTTSDYADAWFCGYTPDLATCVWVGYPKDRTPLDNIEGVGVVTGGTIPAQIWHDYMTTALQNVAPSDFPAPLHPADVQPYTPTRSNGPGSSTPYVAPPVTATTSTTSTTTTGTDSTSTTTTSTTTTSTTGH
jgi:penicillin-binding protein 1A